jgi:hypothetical protein
MVKFNILRAAAAAISGIIMLAGSAHAATNAASDAQLLANIPATARMVVVIHDLAALHKKVDVLAQKLKIPVLPPSLRHIEKTLNLPRGIDAHGTAAVVDIRGTGPGAKAHAVILAPARHPAKAIASMNFSTDSAGLAHGQSAEGQAIYAMAGKGYIMISQHRRALLAFKSINTTVAPMLTESEQPLAARSDVYVLLNIPAMRKPVEKALSEFAPADATTAKGAAGNSTEFKTISRHVVTGMLQDTDSALVSLRISKGAVTLGMVSDEKAGSQMDQLLSCLQPLGTKPLMGLPTAAPLLEAAANKINGPLTAKILRHWANKLSTTSKSGDVSKDQLPALLLQVAALVEPLSDLNAVATVASNTKGPVMQFTTVAASQTPAATAARYRHLMVSESKWMSNFQMGMSPKVQYRTSVSPEPVTIASIPFTVMKQSMVLPAAGTPQNDAVRSAMKMEDAMMGIATQTYLVGHNEHQVIVGANCSRKMLADTVKAAGAGADILDSNSEIMAARQHILAHAAIVAYMDWSPFIAAIAQRIEAMAHVNTPAPAIPATEPMSVSLAVDHHTLQGQVRMPIKNLEQLSARIHALIPLAMMMEMQAMQAGQGGAPNAPQ